MNVNRLQIEEKEINSLVSYVDKNAEMMLVEGLAKILPGAGFITEEKTIATEVKECMWIIDPLDGTTNYLFGIPHYSTSIALRVNNEIVIGLVRDNAKEEDFYAVKSKGAFLNGRPLKTKKSLTMSESLFVTGFPYSNDYDPAPSLQVIKYWLKNSRGLRRYGSAALDLAYAATGRFSCYYEGYLNIWDLAAGALVAKEAGLVVSDYSGENDYLKKGQIIACHPDIYEETLKVIQTNLS